MKAPPVPPSPNTQACAPPPRLWPPQGWGGPSALTSGVSSMDICWTASVKSPFVTSGGCRVPPPLLTPGCLLRSPGPAGTGQGWAAAVLPAARWLAGVSLLLSGSGCGNLEPAGRVTCAARPPRSLRDCSIFTRCLGRKRGDNTRKDGLSTVYLERHFWC